MWPVNAALNMLGLYRTIHIGLAIPASISEFDGWFSFCNSTVIKSDLDV